MKTYTISQVECVKTLNKSSKLSKIAGKMRCMRQGKAACILTDPRDKKQFNHVVFVDIVTIEKKNY